MTADVCLLLEGTYPYVAGGVSSWVHDLIGAHPELRFAAVTMMPDRRQREHRYQVPENLVSLSTISLQRVRRGAGSVFGQGRLVAALEPLVARLLAGGGLAEIAEMQRLLAPKRRRLGRSVLMESPAAWESLARMYEATMADSSFLDYFWSWRSLVGGLYAVMLEDLPPARVYHAVSTGYAGLLAARARIETLRPVILTEHGIYTNERRIEIAMADWLHQRSGRASLGIEKPRRDLKDMWIDTFVSYSRATYQACDEIITLYGGNQEMQRRDGAPAAKLKVIPNGIDYARFSRIVRVPQERPTIALIGRVVPIKDVKTFIRACGLLRERVPDLLAEVMGPTEEDQEYFAECQGLVAHLGLQETVRFVGRVKLDDHLGRLKAIVLTSISEAQPLVILEAGSVGVPSVVTDVGACREMIEGRDDDFGPAGAVTPVSNPAATAEALARLLTDDGWWRRCSEAIVRRVERSYNKVVIDRIYGSLYAGLIARPDSPPPLA
ncbi:MAG: GT4 family glycosyltransferase PelF [Thalassobaculales bacterium]